MNDYLYMNSSEVDVYPAGFRDADHPKAKISSEENITYSKIISSNLKNNNYAFTDPYNDDYYIIVIKGYFFRVFKENIPTGSELKAVICLKNLAEGDGSSYIGKILKPIGIYTDINNPSDSSDILDQGGSFKGLGFTTSSINTGGDTQEYQYVQIRDDDGNLIEKTPRLDASEIRNTTNSSYSISEQLDTGLINAANISTRNQLDVGQILNVGNTSTKGISINTSTDTSSVTVANMSTLLKGDFIVKSSGSDALFKISKNSSGIEDIKAYRDVSISNNSSLTVDNAINNLTFTTNNSSHSFTITNQNDGKTTHDYLSITDTRLNISSDNGSSNLILSNGSLHLPKDIDADETSSSINEYANVQVKDTNGNITSRWRGVDNTASANTIVLRDNSSGIAAKNIVADRGSIAARSRKTTAGATTVSDKEVTIGVQSIDNLNVLDQLYLHANISSDNRHRGLFDTKFGQVISITTTNNSSYCQMNSSGMYTDTVRSQSYTIKKSTSDNTIVSTVQYNANSGCLEITC